MNYKKEYEILYAWLHDVSHDINYDLINARAACKRASSPMLGEGYFKGKTVALSGCLEKISSVINSMPIEENEYLARS